MWMEIDKKAVILSGAKDPVKSERIRRTTSVATTHSDVAGSFASSG
jgi:hypothetical protein